MFDFLKKSRAVKFLCSACLLCSLGSFATINAEAPKKVADAYIKGGLGYGENTIVLDSATLSVGTTDGGKLSGTLKWRDTNDAAGDPVLIDLTNSNEDAGITFYLAEQGSNSSSSQLAVSDPQDLSGSYSINGLQFYASADGDTIGADMPTSAPEYRPTAPGVFEVWARVSNPGTTTLISGPNA